MVISIMEIGVMIKNGKGKHTYKNGNYYWKLS